MTAPEGDPDCERHGTPLHVDAIRGLICAHCDAEQAAQIWAVLGRLWRALTGGDR
jgi:hypothetical protein